ncbi:MAG TPA: VPDSG-CTERM sorting domain-containing protein [Lacunisphaera sp.]|nr:VPDSG-CTERM sorting domain-containing protein [Lacunisphaera sp.]
MKKLIIASLAAAVLSLSAQAYTFSVTSTGFISTSTGLTHGYAGTWGLNGSSYTSLWNDINTGGKVITSATLTLTGIYDWVGETPNAQGQYDPMDALFVNILGGLNTGLSSPKLFDQDAVGRDKDTAWPTEVSPFYDASAWNNTLHNSGLTFTDAQPGSNSLLKVTTQGTGGNDTKVGTPSSVTWSDPTGGQPSTLVITFNAGNMSLLTSLIDADANTNSPYVGLGFAAECHYFMNSATLNITTGVPDSGSTIVLMGLGLVALAMVRRSRK